MPRFAPQVVSLEARMVLSAANLTPAAYEAARGRIVEAAHRLAVTGDLDRADANLERAVRTIPQGGALLPTLEAEAASGPASPRILVNSLNDFIRDRVTTGDITVSSPALRKVLGITPPVAPTPPAAPTPTPPSPGPGLPSSGSPTPSSLSVNIFNSISNSSIYVSFSQVVNGVRTQLTGVSIGAGVTARFVPIITQNSSPILVSAQNQSTIGYWETTAPASFSQLKIAYLGGRGQFYFR